MKKKLLYILIFIGLLLLEIAYSGIIIFILKELGINIYNLSEPLRSLSLILIDLSLIIIVYFIYRKELEKEFKDFINNLGKYLSFGAIIWFIGLFLMITTNIIIINIYPSQASNEEAVQEIIANYPIYASFAACILAPFIEEIIFRKSLHKIISNKTLFIIMSGLLFGLAHNLTSFGSMQMLYIIPYGLFGSLFAYAYAKKENIFISMAFHLIHNTILIIFSLIRMGVL